MSIAETYRVSIGSDTGPWRFASDDFSVGSSRLELVSLTFASWNPIIPLLRQIDGLRRIA
jgi:hypothetical protein